MAHRSDDYYYRNRRATRSAKRARAIRIFSYLFGPGDFSSVFLAFDPFYKFKFGKEDVSPVKRVRRIHSIRGRLRSRTRSIKDINCTTPIYAVAPGKNAYGPFTCTSTTTSTTNALTAQESYFGFVSDTTIKTRPEDVRQGELEMFIPTFVSSRRNLNWKRTETEGVGSTGFGNYHNHSEKLHSSRVTTAARVTRTAIDAYLAQERSYFSDNVESKALSLLARALPTSRSFDALREIGELRDLPMTLKTSLLSVVDAVKGRGVDVSSVLLNKEFGWDPLFDSLVSLVRLPTKIAKRVNYLIQRSRSGQPTTLRHRFQGTEAMGVAGTINFDPAIDEIVTGTSTTAARYYEWRIAVNSIIKLPPLELPVLKDELVSRLYGLKFRPSDLYNLIPWTWLLDWFTGIGDYIDAYSAMNEDTSVINWGLLTYASTGFVKGDQSGYVNSDYFYRMNNDPLVAHYKTLQTHSSAILLYKYQRRVDLASVSDVKRSWDPNGLSGFQQSILAALLTQDAQAKRFGRYSAR